MKSGKHPPKARGGGPSTSIRLTNLNVGRLAAEKMGVYGGYPDN
jgi:hypothetical protein